jgi:hypothetical protein
MQFPVARRPLAGGQDTSMSRIWGRSRERVLGIRLEQLLVGSVAVDLTHRQHRGKWTEPQSHRNE